MISELSRSEIRLGTSPSHLLLNGRVSRPASACLNDERPTARVRRCPPLRYLRTSTFGHAHCDGRTCHCRTVLEGSWERSRRGAIWGPNPFQARCHGEKRRLQRMDERGENFKAPLTRRDFPRERGETGRGQGTVAVKYSDDERLRRLN